MGTLASAKKKSIQGFVQVNSSQVVGTYVMYIQHEVLCTYFVIHSTTPEFTDLDGYKGDTSSRRWVI
jgi:hypothetical protein